MFQSACIVIQMAMMIKGTDSDCLPFCSDATLIFKNEIFSARSHHFYFVNNVSKKMNIVSKLKCIECKRYHHTFS